MIAQTKCLPTFALVGDRLLPHAERIVRTGTLPIVRGRRAFLGAAIGLTTTHAARAATREPPSNVDAEQDFDELWRTLGERYCYFGEKTTDWAKVRATYHATAAAAQTDAEFLEIIRAVLAELYDAHTHLSSPPLGMPRWPEYDLVVERVNDVARVVAVRDGSAPAFLGVRTGDEIVAIDQVPVIRAAARHVPRCLTRSDPAAEAYAWNVAVAGLTGKPRVLSVRDGKGTPKTLALPIVPNLPEASVSSDIIHDNLGYIAIRSFAEHSAIEQFDAALDRLQNTRGLLIDVRRNGGGDTTVARPMMGRFITQGRPYARMRRRDGAWLSNAWTEHVVPRGPFTYTAKVVVLVDHWSASMAEGFPMGMRGIGRARVVGTQMARLGAGVFSLRLDRTGVLAQYSAEPVYDVNDVARSHFRPDVVVSEGVDLLQAGVTELRRMIDAGPGAP
jgi:carboxyl-terminal processing protease